MTNSIALGVAFKDPQLDGAILGETAANTGKIGFYGKVPVVQRTYASSVHASVACASSLVFAAGQQAIVQELMNTMIGLGIYATA